MFNALWKARKHDSMVATLKITLNILDLNKLKIQCKTEFDKGHFAGYKEGLLFALNALEREDK